jgi:hypothetical protein
MRIRDGLFEYTTSFISLNNAAIADGIVKALKERRVKPIVQELGNRSARYRWEGLYVSLLYTQNQ